MLGLGAVGCNDSDQHDPSAPVVAKVDGFLPLDGGQTDASYLVDGTVADYTLKVVKSGDKTSFEALSHNDLVETETYLVKDSNVFLCHALGEDFHDPIPLMKFPLRIGDKYEWKGTLTSGREDFKGTATVDTVWDSVRMKDGSLDAVKVEIDLRIEDVGTRRLSFWFVNGRGVLRTEMGKNVREPKH